MWEYDRMLMYPVKIKNTNHITIRYIGIINTMMLLE